MRSLRQIASRVKARMAKDPFPYVVTLRTFDPAGVKFEVTNPVEEYRVVQHGNETEYTAAMLADLGPEDVLYDIGGNVGMVSLHAARKCTTVSFEPDPSYRRRLEVNAALNPSHPFTIEPIAISDSDGAVTLFTDGDDGISPSLVDKGGRGRVTATATSLDNLMEGGRLPAPTVIKFDIEGAEILALRGAAALFSGPNRPRALFIEVHDTLLGGFGSTADEVYGLLEKYGYTDAIYRARRAEQTHLILHASR